MTIEKLRAAARAQPFVPFSILTADGRRYRVRHPEFILIAPKAERTFVVASSPEDYALIDLLLVTALEFGQAPSRRSGRRAG